jgi:hypothetical protein
LLSPSLSLCAVLVRATVAIGVIHGVQEDSTAMLDDEHPALPAPRRRMERMA